MSNLKSQTTSNRLMDYLFLGSIGSGHPRACRSSKRSFINTPDVFPQLVNVLWLFKLNMKGGDKYER